jgi:hypothetical protein
VLGRNIKFPLKTVECFKYSGKVATNYARYKLKIELRIYRAEAEFKIEETIFTSKYKLFLKKKLEENYI